MWIAKDNAGRRTKNRLREHPNMQAFGRSPSVVGLGGVEGILMECPDSDCDWEGWMPAKEVRKSRGVGKDPLD